MKLEFKTFGGERPKISPHVLDPQMAQVASNCKLIKGDLRAFRSTLKDEALTGTNVQSLFLYEENGNDNWVESANDLDFVKSPISDDSYERVYFTGETQPRFFANDNVSSPFDESVDFYKLGIPAPATAPTVTTTGGGATYKGYVYSFVNSYGDEGPPSPVGSDDDFSSGAVAIEDIEAAPSDRAVTKIYLYRTNASGDGTAEFQFVLEATWFSASVNYVVGDYVIYGTDLYKCTTQHDAAAWDAGHFTAGDAVADADLTSVFPKTNYDPPPTDLIGLIAFPGGILAGISGNNLCFSEPFHPHAWPTGYQVAFDETPVGLGVIGSTVIVTTTGYPYEVYGSHPDSMSKTKGAAYYPCTSKRGIVSARGAVFYPTYEGLVKRGSSDEDATYSIVTEKIMSEDDWDDYGPTTLAGYFYQGRYFGFDSVNSVGFILDFVDGFFIPLSTYAHAGYVDDEFYVVVDDTALVDEANPPENMPLCVSKWEGNTTSYLIYTWRSKEFMLPIDTNFSIARIELDEDFYGDVNDLIDLATLNVALFAADLEGAVGMTALGGQDLAGDTLYDIGSFTISSDINFKLYADGTLKCNKVIEPADKKTFRLPSGFVSRRYYIELSGYIPVKSLVIATSADEIQ